MFYAKKYGFSNSNNHSKHPLFDNHCYLRFSHLWHSWHEVATGGLELIDDGVSWHGSHAGDTLHVLVGQVGFALLFALSKSNIEGFGANDSSVHLSHSLGGLLGGGEADKAEALGATLLQHHLKI